MACGSWSLLRWRSTGHWSAEWFERLDRELVTAAALSWFRDLRGHIREGRQVLRSLLDRAEGSIARQARLRALNAAAYLAFYAGHRRDAQAGWQRRLICVE